jgi:hypothetical protein
MFKELFSGLKKLLGRKDVMAVVIIAIVVLALMSYSNSKTFALDGMENGLASSDPAAVAAAVAESTTESVPAAANVSSPMPGFDRRPVNAPGDLLPSAAASDFSDLNPGLTVNSMPDMDRLTPIARPDNRNPNYQLRSDVPIPRTEVGPWNNSTILPDTTRSPLEIGSH